MSGVFPHGSGKRNLQTSDSHPPTSTQYRQYLQFPSLSFQLCFVILIWDVIRWWKYSHTCTAWGYTSQLAVNFSPDKQFKFERKLGPIEKAICNQADIKDIQGNSNVVEMVKHGLSYASYGIAKMRSGHLWALFMAMFKATDCENELWSPLRDKW